MLPLNPTQIQSDASSGLDEIRRQLMEFTQSMRDKYGDDAKDLAKGTAAGALQAPFDYGAALAPFFSMIAPTTGAALGPLDDRVRQYIAQSPLATNTRSGELGQWLGQMLAPAPGAGRLVGETTSLAELIAKKLIP